MQLFDKKIIDEILTADPVAVRDALKDRWGIILPGDEGWEDDESGRYLALAVYYFATRHPGRIKEIGIAATMIQGFTTGIFGGFGQDQDPLYVKAESAILAFAGGQPAPPGEMIGLTPPQDKNGKWLVPGGQTAFTLACIDMLEALLFRGEDEARRIAQDYLASSGDLGERACEIFMSVSRWDYGDNPVVCHDCGAKDMDHFYTAKQLGYHLCPVCFESRKNKGLAKESKGGR